MELLIGCGNNREKRVVFPEIQKGWFNLTTLDVDKDCNPDVLHDLNDLPLPFDDNMFNEIHAYQVLEWAWADPGHRRVITPGTLVFLSQKEYEVQVGDTGMTDYRSVWDADFDLIGMDQSDDTFGFVIQAIKD